VLASAASVAKDSLDLHPISVNSGIFVCIKHGLVFVSAMFVWSLVEYHRNFLHTLR